MAHSPDLLLELAHLVEQHRGRLAELESMDNGKPKRVEPLRQAVTPTDESKQALSEDLSRRALAALATASRLAACQSGTQPTSTNSWTRRLRAS